MASAGSGRPLPWPKQGCRSCAAKMAAGNTQLRNIRRDITPPMAAVRLYLSVVSVERTVAES